jgi:hypothetical protein
VIVFENPGEIDIRSISTFGVSVKEGSNPIGFFGTGLKYAIAVLLRERHIVTVFSGLTLVEFAVSRDSVRGQEFDFVTMAVDGAAPVAIGFTTELGKKWDLWMAYREIACNCKDEGGDAQFEHDMVAPEAGITKVVVVGDAFESIFSRSHTYILDDDPQFVVNGMEIRSRPGEAYFYRGVRIYELPTPAIFTYNDTAQVELTEDRTAKFPHMLAYRAAQSILQATDKRFLRTCILADDKTFEGKFDYHGWGVRASPEFLEVVGDCMSDRSTKINETAVQVWKDATKLPFAPREITLTDVQRQSLERALDFCARIGFQIRGAYPIKIVESLGEGALGLAQDQSIFIAERVYDMGGTKQLASTLIEEYVHLRHGWHDLTRELQTFLFDKLVSVGEELVGEPL